MKVVKKQLKLFLNDNSWERNHKRLSYRLVHIINNAITGACSKPLIYGIDWISRMRRKSCFCEKFMTKVLQIKFCLSIDIIETIEFNKNIAKFEYLFSYPKHDKNIISVSYVTKDDKKNSKYLLLLHCCIRNRQLHWGLQNAQNWFRLCTL